MKTDTMQRAMQLMQAGDLRAATRAIQHGLAGGSRSHPASHPSSRPAAAATGSIIDVEFDVIDAAAVGTPPCGAGNEAASAPAWRRPQVPPCSPRRPRVHADDGDSNFQPRRFACDAGELDYQLFIPAGLTLAGAPLLVMLHGCTQTPDDFARGTRMNRLATEHGYVVVWPAQSVERNQNRCWNWFRGSDQQRGHGEPAMIAALTRQLVADHALDARRAYVAGLSAGGAMAAVLADTHPDVYAAIGVHSGLPIGLASDVPSAFAAMRKGAGAGRRPAARAGTAVPAIVFHGDGDRTVHPRNGDGVVAQSLADGTPADECQDIARSVEQGIAAGGRRYTRTVHRAAAGRVAAEHWLIHGAAHAWSGGDASGSYTDPAGPDASAQMLRFFADCRRAHGG